MKRFLGVAAMAWALAGGAAWAGEKFLWVESERANVRAEPRVGARVVARASFGERLLAVEKVGDWYRVALADGSFGYVHEDVVTDEAPGHLWVEVDRATVRQAPLAEAKAVAEVERGTMLESDGARGDWFHVRWGDGRSGWIHEQEVDDDPPATLFVITDRAVLHATPSPDAEAVASLPVGASLQELGKAGQFVEVRTDNGETGYVFKDAVSDERPTWLFVKVSDAAVVARPAVDAEVVARLPSGAEVLAFDETHDFYLVLLEDGRVGWLHEDDAIPMGKR